MSLIPEYAELISAATDAVKARLAGNTPLVGIVLGSGLGKLANQIEDPIVIPYKEIRGFPFPPPSDTRAISLWASWAEKPSSPCRDASIATRDIPCSWSPCPSAS